MQGSNEDAHTERFMDTGVWEEGEGGTNGESNWETYTLSCVKWIANGHLLYDSANSNRGSLIIQKGGIEGEMEGSGGKGYKYNYDPFALMCSRDHHDIVKHLASN